MLTEIDYETILPLLYQYTRYCSREEVTTLNGLQLSDRLLTILVSHHNQTDHNVYLLQLLTEMLKAFTGSHLATVRLVVT